MKTLAVVLLLGAAAAPALAALPGGGATHSQIAQAAPPHTAAQAFPTTTRPTDKTPPGPGPTVRPLTPTDPILAHLSPVYETCVHKAGSTNDMLDCGAKEGERWDARLNRAYQARMSSLNDRQRTALKIAQKAWLAFRLADCAAYEDEDWGSISRIDASQCVLRRTVERALELEAFPADHGPG